MRRVLGAGKGDEEKCGNRAKRYCSSGESERNKKIIKREAYPSELTPHNYELFFCR